jgi:PleD family two-component response regulator
MTGPSTGVSSYARLSALGRRTCSTFWFTASVDDARAESQPAAIGTHESAVELAHKAKLFEGLRVLVIEDTASDQKVAKAMLRRLSADPQFTDNGLLGLEALKNSSFDVVFMDCQLPVVDGCEATRQLRAFEKAASRRP